MKQPILADRAGQSSYFSAPKPPNFDENEPPQDVSWKLRFPNSKADLWNNMPCGDPIVFGIRHYRPVTLLCLKRCLRLAHQHSAQHGSPDKSAAENNFHGFLMGTTTNTDDERGIVIDLDRFDPGTVRSDGHKTPSTPLPGDAIIPVIFSNSLPQAHDATSTFSVQDYENAFKLLHHQVSTRLSVENTSLFPIRLHCFCSEDGSQSGDISMELHWVSPCVSNSLRAIPVKPVPIIPTALAKNLSGPLNLSTLQNSSKSGYVSMNQSRKLLLLLDSDPKCRSISTVGIWVSGVISVHSPIVWLACMRYLHCADIYERIMADGQFLLVLYSAMSKAPIFFQVKSDDNGKLNFDLLYSQQPVQISKQSHGDSERPVEFRLELTSESLPDGAFSEKEIFHEALENMDVFIAPQKQNLENQDPAKQDDENRILSRGRQPKKGSSIPHSILRKSSGGRGSSGSRGRSSSNGVSFSLAVEDSEIFTNATPMPLPSPHPSTIHQSPALVKPSVPELSIIFDENYPAVTPGVQNARQPSISPSKRRNMPGKVHSNSPGIRSPLKNIKNLNPPSRGISPQEARPGPVKPHVNHYQRHPVPVMKNGMAPAFFPPTGPIQRRSRSASDCIRGPGGRSHPVMPPGPQPHPVLSHHAAYTSTHMQGYGYPPGIPTTVPTTYPYQPYPQARTQVPVRAPPPNNQYPVVTQQNMNPYPPPSVAYQPQKSQPVMNPAYYSNPPQMTPAPTFQETSSANLLATPGALSYPTPSNRVPQSSVPQPTKEVQGPISQAPLEVTKPPVPSESPVWMNQLPPEAYQLLMHQDAQLKMLQAQIQKLLTMQEEKQEKVVTTTTTETSTSTDPEMTSNENTKISMGTNTGTSLCVPNADAKDGEKTEDAASSCESSPWLTNGSGHQSAHGTDIDGPETSAKQVFNTQTEETVRSKSDPLRCESQCTDRYPISEFASIHLDETNLREIASANIEEDSDVRSLASSLKAVDLPALETSTEQSSFDTPARKIPMDMWNAQDSPILGESASMCIVPPINLNQSLQEVEEQEVENENREEDVPKDENFMKNLLNQVRDMLKKADTDGASELSSENSAASTPQRIDKKRVKKTRCSKEDRVARATRKQLHKMGVKFDDDTINVLSSAVIAEDRTKKQEQFTYTLPEPLVPRLNYTSIFAGTSSSKSIFSGPSSTELSMHANAIALKYLSNEQLEEIAALSKLGKRPSDAFSPLKSKSGSSISEGGPSMHDIFGADVKKLGEKRLPGMSLVSPCNMSLATRKYMEKYGLIDGDGTSDDDDEEEQQDKPQKEQLQRPQTPVNEGSYPPSTGASPVLKGLRPPSGGQHTKLQGRQDPPKDPQRVQSFPGFPQPEPGFSELKMNLGDTLDMIQPFLDDLGRHRQQTPSSGTSGRDSQSGTRSSQTGSSRDKLTSISERSHPQPESPSGEGDSTERILPLQIHRNGQIKRNSSKSREASPVDALNLRHKRQQKDNEVSQVLSPELLRAVAEGKKLTQTPGGSTQVGYDPPHSHRCNRQNDEEPQEDFLAGTWPRHYFRSRSESDFLHPGSRDPSQEIQERRRLSSSPRFPVDHQQPSFSNSHRGCQRPRTSPPSSSKMKRIRAIQERQSKQLEDLKEVEWNSEKHSQENGHLSSEEEEEEPILTSRVTDAFKEKEELSKNKSEERSRRENSPHFLQHLQTQNKRTENENENFLDFEKIRNLPKLD